VAVEEAGLVHGLGFSTPEMDVYGFIWMYMDAYQTIRLNVEFSVKVVPF